MKIATMALKNVFRNKRRTMLTILSIVAGIVTMVLFDGFVCYTLWGLQESTIRNGYGHLQISSSEEYFLTGSFDPFSYLLHNEQEVTRRLKALPKVKAVIPELMFSGTLGSMEKSGIITVQAVPPDESSALLSFRSIIEGRDIFPTDRYCVVLTKGVAKKLNAKIGDIMTMMAITQGGGINAIDVEVVGIASSGLGELDNILVYMDLASAKEFLWVENVPRLLVVLEKTEYTDDVYTTFVNKIAPQLEQPVAIKKWHELAEYYQQVHGFYQSLLSVIRLIIIVVVIFTIVNTMSMAVLERTREIGALRALGTKKPRIVTIFVAEGIWIGLFGGIIGVTVGFGVSYFINTVFGGIYIPPPPGMAEGYLAQFSPNMTTAWQGILIAVTVSALGSVFPAFKTVRLKIAEALRYL